MTELGQQQQQLQQERLGPDKTTEREKVVKDQRPKSLEGAGHTAISVKRFAKKKTKDKSELK